MMGCSGLYLKNNTEEKATEQYDGDDGTAGLRREKNIRDSPGRSKVLVKFTKSLRLRETGKKNFGTGAHINKTRFYFKKVICV